MSYMTEEDKDRLIGYSHYEKIFEGKHQEVFDFSSRSALKADGTKQEQLLYLVCGFGALISKVSADFLFGEKVGIKLPQNAPKEARNFTDDLIDRNSLHTRFYESSLSNSYFGDSVVKERVDDEGKVIVEFITPQIYFVNHAEDNINEVESIELCWEKEVGKVKYLRKEIHFKGKIVNKLYFMESEALKRVPLDTIYPDLKDEEETGVDDFLVRLIPNWKTSTRFFGISDYSDLDSLFDEMNNRMMRISGILNKHSDPKLAVPPGVLDEKGQVRRENFEMFEVSAGSSGLQVPQYITWDAGLEAAFKQIDQLVKFIFLFSEISPAAFGMDEGGIAESGRALKFRLIRTLAKISRKRNYYEEAIKWMFITAQKLKKVSNPIVPEIEWQDGIPNDTREQAEIEEIRLRSGTTSKESSIKRLDKGGDKETKEEMKKIDEDEKKSTPSLGMTPPEIEEGEEGGERT